MLQLLLTGLLLTSTFGRAFSAVMCNSLVTALALHQEECVCSTLRLWKDGECTAVLEGHTGAVQCVLYLPSGEIVSGANDNSIRVWSGGKCLHVLSGHTDTVRCSTALILDSNQAFILVKAVINNLFLNILRCPLRLTASSQRAGCNVCRLFMVA